METFGWLLGFGWAMSGFVAVCMHGKPGLWRIAIFLGPLSFFIFPPDK